MQNVGQLSAVHKVSYHFWRHKSFSPKLLEIGAIFIWIFFTSMTLQINSLNEWHSSWITRYIFKFWCGHLWLRQIPGRVHWSMNNDVLRSCSCVCGTAAVSWGTAVQILINMNVRCRNIAATSVCVCACAVSHVTSNISHRTYGAAAEPNFNLDVCTGPKTFYLLVRGLNTDKLCCVFSSSAAHAATQRIHFLTQYTHIQ